MKKFIIIIIISNIIFVFTLLLSGCTSKSISSDDSFEAEYTSISMSIFEDSVRHARFRFNYDEPPYPVYNERQIAGIAENMLLLQNEDGGWPKNVDWYIKLDDQFLKIVKTKMIANGEGRGKSTFDNRTTYSHIDYLADVYTQIPQKKYKAAIKRGINWVLSVQNKDSNGFAGIDVDAVTYNDDVMSGVLRTLKRIAYQDDPYNFLDDELRKKAGNAYDRGLSCILNSQVRVSGKLTAWGQQHDHRTLQPIWARDFEPPSITANESVGVIILLMEIEKPAPAVIKAVIAGCEWLDKVRIKGKRLVYKPVSDETSTGFSGYERVLEDDTLVFDLWCRFYDLETEKPLLYDRGRQKVDHYNKLSSERRNGYHYFGTWPETLLQFDFPAWKKRHGL